MHSIKKLFQRFGVAFKTPTSPSHDTRYNLASTNIPIKEIVPAHDLDAKINEGSQGVSRIISVTLSSSTDESV